MNGGQCPDFEGLRHRRIRGSGTIEVRASGGALIGGAGYGEWRLRITSNGGGTRSFGTVRMKALRHADGQ